MMMTPSLSRVTSTLMIAVCVAGCEQLAYQQMNDPSRDAWQKPKDVIEQLAIVPGSRVADIGAGGGYFTWYLADAVGPQGTVYAVDTGETGLDIIRRDMQERHVSNVCRFTLSRWTQSCRVPWILSSAATPIIT